MSTQARQAAAYAKAHAKHPKACFAEASAKVEACFEARAEA